MDSKLWKVSLKFVFRTSELEQENTLRERTLDHERSFGHMSAKGLDSLRLQVAANKSFSHSELITEYQSAQSTLDCHHQKSAYTSLSLFCFRLLEERELIIFKCLLSLRAMQKTILRLPFSGVLRTPQWGAKSKSHPNLANRACIRERSPLNYR